MDDIYKSIKEYSPNKKRKILIVIDDMIADMFINKKPNPIVTELFIKGRKLNISLVFITQSYFAVPKLYIHFLNWDSFSARLKQPLQGMELQEKKHKKIKKD